MNCQDFQQHLDQHADTDPVTGAAMAQHAHGCADCAARWAWDRRLRQQLRDLSAPEPDAGFADRVLARARAAQPRRRAPELLRYAIAASVLVALGVALSLRPPATESATAPLRVVQLQPAAVQPVRLVFNSPTAVQDVTVHLALPAGVELAAFPGQRELRWQTDLQPGANLLELPVRVTGDGGVLTASLSLGDEHRQFSVRLQPAPKPSAVRSLNSVLAMALPSERHRDSEVNSHV